ncbi:hypothetical protein HII31_05584 [Pseudocercospora fuligena]|uniref:Uncharacterized protein n=1 Tax=Pseudocercospora fuligena TaxID=685502 RepID=A0A8H6RLF2_9PEZI|nr:hypothetical protein HII31_05584 [Pseudocercospora fuligena]
MCRGGIAADHDRLQHRGAGLTPSQLSVRRPSASAEQLPDGVPPEAISQGDDQEEPYNRLAVGGGEEVKDGVKERRRESGEYYMTKIGVTRGESCGQNADRMNQR